MADAQSPEIVRCGDDASEAIRRINHVLVPASLPATGVYSALGNLKLLGSALPQAFIHLSAGLGKSVETHDVYEDDGGDPVASVATVVDHLIRAAKLAVMLEEELAQAQSAITGEGFREQ